MLLGTPSVTTAIGAEGMQVDDSWPGAICEDFDTFAKQAAILYQDPSCWQSASKLGVDNARELFGQPHFKEDFINQVAQLSNSLEQHRHSNFLGLMLNHHHHRSTQFNVTMD